MLNLAATPSLRRLAWAYLARVDQGEWWPRLEGWRERACYACSACAFVGPFCAACGSTLSPRSVDVLPLDVPAGLAIARLRLGEVLGVADPIGLNLAFERGMWGDMPEVYGWQMSANHTSHPTNPRARAADDIGYWLTSEVSHGWRSRTTYASDTDCETRYRWVPGMPIESGTKRRNRV